MRDLRCVIQLENDADPSITLVLYVDTCSLGYGLSMIWFSRPPKMLFLMENSEIKWGANGTYFS